MIKFQGCKELEYELNHAQHPLPFRSQMPQTVLKLLIASIICADWATVSLVIFRFCWYPTGPDRSRRTSDHFSPVIALKQSSQVLQISFDYINNSLPIPVHGLYQNDPRASFFLGDLQATSDYQERPLLAGHISKVPRGQWTSHFWKHSCFGDLSIRQLNATLKMDYWTIHGMTLNSREQAWRGVDSPCIERKCQGNQLKVSDQKDFWNNHLW